MGSHASDFFMRTLAMLNNAYMSLKDLQRTRPLRLEQKKPCAVTAVGLPFYISMACVMPLPRFHPAAELVL